MGMLNAQVARAFGGRVIISELLEKKINVAKELGFTEFVDPSRDDLKQQIQDIIGHDSRIDVIIVCVGNSKANAQAQEVADLDTRIVYFAAGYPAPEIKIDSNIIHYKRLELIGTIGSDTDDFQMAVDMLDKRLIKVEKLIEKRFPLDKLQEAYELAATPGSFRVSVHTWEK